MLIQSCLYHHCSSSPHQSLFLSQLLSFAGCARCSELKTFTQVLLVTLSLETTVFSTIIQPDSLHVIAIFVDQCLDPHWYHNNLVTFSFQEEAVATVTELIHSNQPMSLSSHALMLISIISCTLVYLVLASSSSSVYSFVLSLLVHIFHMVAAVLSSQSSCILLLVSASVHLFVL